MPIWYFQRAPEYCNVHERVVADALNALPGDWVIRWGWRYWDNQNTEREGDFLILGPGGHVLVLEVKGTASRAFALSGYWEEEDDDRHDPTEQLNAQWQGAINALRATAVGHTVPLVHRAFAFPNQRLHSDHVPDALPKDRWVDGHLLENFTGWWSTHVASKINQCPNSRELFLSTFAKALKPANLLAFIRETDKQFAAFKGSEFSLLRRLMANRQLLIEGGPGTGKTFMALETAKLFAEAGTGQEILFVCYNRALGGKLMAMVERLKPERGRITVRSWETLALETLSQAGVELHPPEQVSDQTEFYDSDLPNFLLLTCNEGKIAARFDALVVDEGQDIDTAYPTDLPESVGRPGWWEFILQLLHQRERARIALFYDSAQRHVFRPQRFAPQTLFDLLSQPAHCLLERPVRYTRPIFEFLLQSSGEPCNPLLAKLLHKTRLPEGPAVEIRNLAHTQDTAQGVASILQHWIGIGLCKVKDVCILGMRRRLSDSSIGHLTELAGYPLQPYPVPDPDNPEPTPHPLDTLQYLSINRAKGLDFLAVILIDTPARSAQPFLLACTRARQMLGVVTVGQDEVTST